MSILKLLIKVKGGQIFDTELDLVFTGLKIGPVAKIVMLDSKQGY